jgi:hypothetical protein
MLSLTGSNSSSLATQNKGGGLFGLFGGGRSDVANVPKPQTNLDLPGGGGLYDEQNADLMEQNVQELKERAAATIRGCKAEADGYRYAAQIIAARHATDVVKASTEAALGDAIEKNEQKFNHHRHQMKQRFNDTRGAILNA